MPQTILTLWPLIKWVLQALGMMGTEDRELERQFQLKLLVAAEERKTALLDAYKTFLTSTRPSAERVYVWVNSFEALVRPLIVVLSAYDIFFAKTSRIIPKLQALKDLGAIGFVALLPLLWVFLGPYLMEVAAKIVEAAFLGAAKAVGGASGQPSASGAGPKQPSVNNGDPHNRLEPPEVSVPSLPSFPREDIPRGERER